MVTVPVACPYCHSKASGTSYSKMSSVPAAEAATALNVLKMASSVRYGVTPNHEKTPGSSRR